MRVPVLRSSRTRAVWALVDSLRDKGSLPWMLEDIGVPLAERTVGPSSSLVGWSRWLESELVTKVPVAPESRIADLWTVGELGRTATVLQCKFSFRLLIVSVVPTCQVGSQKHPAVLPLSMLAKLAAF
jgi:hypothetical protein